MPFRAVAWHVAALATRHVIKLLASPRPSSPPSYCEAMKRHSRTSQTPSFTRRFDVHIRWKLNGRKMNKAQAECDCVFAHRFNLGEKRQIGGNLHAASRELALPFSLKQLGQMDSIEPVLSLVAFIVEQRLPSAACATSTATGNRPQCILVRLSQKALSPKSN